MVNGVVLFCIEKKRASMFEIPALLFMSFEINRFRPVYLP